MTGRPGKEPKDSSGRRGRRSNGDGQGGKARRKRSDAAKVNFFSIFIHGHFAADLAGKCPKLYSSLIVVGHDVGCRWRLFISQLKATYL